MNEAVVTVFFFLKTNLKIKLRIRDDPIVNLKKKKKARLFFTDLTPKV